MSRNEGGIVRRNGWFLRVRFVLRDNVGLALGDGNWGCWVQLVWFLSVFGAFWVSTQLVVCLCCQLAVLCVLLLPLLDWFGALYSMRNLPQSCINEGMSTEIKKRSFSCLQESLADTDRISLSKSGLNLIFWFALRLQ